MKRARRIPNRISELRPLSTWAVEAASELGCPRSRCFDIDLCLTEGVSNVIRHGYTDDAPHEIDIELTREPGAVVVCIEDDARPFDPLSVPEPLRAPIENARPSGRGIALLRDSADAVSYERVGGRNRLSMRFAFDD